MILASTDPPHLDEAARASAVPPDAGSPRDAPAAPSTAAQPLGQRRDTPRVLVVEDDDTCRRGICRNLRLAGYEVLDAADGVQALELIEAHGVDLVVTDLMMPNMNGVDLILNVVLATPRIPVIAITGTDDHDGCIKAARLFGAERVFSKPFGSQSLLAAIADALET